MTARIRLYAHPLRPDAVETFEAPSVGQWLLDRYGGRERVPLQIFAGEPSDETEITHDIPAMLAGDGEFVVLQSPGTEAILINIAISLVVGAVASLLAPKPKMPANVNRTQQSPNNALGSRENQVRLQQRVEDIYGTIDRAIPSLMMPTYTKYVNNRKFEYGYYCVSRGYCNLTELRDGDTLIADIPGARAEVWWPFTSPNTGAAPVQMIGGPVIDDILSVSRAEEVDGLTLYALNQLQLPAGALYKFTPDAAGDKITQNERNPNFNALIAPGDEITVSMAPYSHAGPPVLVVDYSGTYTVDSVGDGFLTVVGSTWPREVVNHPANIGSATTPSEWTSWVTLDGATRTEVWVNVVAPQGLYKDNGGRSTSVVDYELQIEQLHATTLAPLGVVETLTGSIAGSVSDELAETVEHATAWAGPARVRMRRTNAHDFAFAGTVVDELKWADLYSVSPIGGAHFGCKTTIHTVTEANARATAIKARQLNCKAARLLPTFNGSTFSGSFDAAGLHISGTISETSKLVDIIPALAIDPKIGRRPIAEVDMAQLWGVQQALDAWNAAAGQCNYTFDDDRMSFEEMVTIVAQAGFCEAYRQNGKIRLALDRPQTSNAAMFTHRNKAPGKETLTRTFANAAEHDGVEFVYADPESHQSETIRLPLGGSATRPKKIEIPGIRNFSQAWLRANREWNRIRYKRTAIEFECLGEARNLLPNLRIAVVDNTRFRSWDGEVVGQSGLELTLSRDVEWLAGEPHSIVLQRRDGTLQSIAVTAGSDAARVVLATAPSEAIVATPDPDAGIRTIFSFAADSQRAAQAYLVQDIDLGEEATDYPRVQAVNYAPEYFAADTAAIPARATVIN